MIQPRRALLGLLVGCAAAATWSTADALSWRRATCNEFRQSVLDHDAFVRASVVRTWDHRASGEDNSAEVETRVDEAIIGRLPRGMPIVFTATASEIGGMPFGFIPAEGQETVLFVDRDADRRWVVKSAMTANEYDEYWVRRCAF